MPEKNHCKVARKMVQVMTLMTIVVAVAKYFGKFKEMFRGTDSDTSRSRKNIVADQSISTGCDCTSSSLICDKYCSVEFSHHGA